MSSSVTPPALGRKTPQVLPPPLAPGVPCYKSLGWCECVPKCAVINRIEPANAQDVVYNAIWSVDYHSYCDLDLYLDYCIWGPDGITCDEYCGAVAFSIPTTYCTYCDSHSHIYESCPEYSDAELSEVQYYDETDDDGDSANEVGWDDEVDEVTEEEVDAVCAPAKSAPLSAMAEPWFPSYDNSIDPPYVLDPLSLVDNMFRWERLEEVRRANTNAICNNFLPARKRRSELCHCGLKVAIGTCWHFGTNYGRRSLVCGNGSCRFMEVLPGKNYAFLAPPVSTPAPRAQKVSNPPAPPSRTAMQPQGGNKAYPDVAPASSLATRVKQAPIYVVARPLDESQDTLAEKTWTVQILHGLEDVLQEARTLKVRLKFKKWRARRKAGGPSKVEKALNSNSPRTHSPMLSVNTGLSGLERRRLAKRRGRRRKHKSTVAVGLTVKFSHDKYEWKFLNYPPVFLSYIIFFCLHMFLRLGGVWLSAALVRGQLP